MKSRGLKYGELQIATRDEIPVGHYVVCIVGKCTWSRLIKDLLISVLSQATGERFIDYWILILDFKNLLFVQPADNKYEISKLYYQSICNDFRNLSDNDIREIYFQGRTRELEEKYQFLLDLKWEDYCLILNK